MNIIEKIINAIQELYEMNCKEENLLIAFSPLVERYLIDEVEKSVLGWSKPKIAGTLTLAGIKTYGLHPYNEIVVYDSKHAAYFPKLIKKIDVSPVVKYQE